MIVHYILCNNKHDCVLIKDFTAVVLNWEGTLPGECEPLHSLQHGKFLNRNVSLPNTCYLVSSSRDGSQSTVRWNFSGQIRAACMQTLRGATRAAMSNPWPSGRMRLRQRFCAAHFRFSL